METLEVGIAVFGVVAVVVNTINPCIALFVTKGASLHRHGVDGAARVASQGQ